MQNILEMHFSRIPAIFFLTEAKEERPFAASPLKYKLDERRERCQPSIVSVLHQMQHLVIYPLA